MTQREQGAEEPLSAAGAEARTFLIADISGYTAFTDRRGDEAGAQLAARFADIAEGEIKRFGGELLELRGDEALGSFVSARQALRAAVGLQERYRTEGGPQRAQGIP